MLLLLPRLAAAEVDGGMRWDDALYAACPAADAPTQLDGGWLLSDARVRRVDCALVSCDTQRRELIEAPPTFSAASMALAWSLFGVGLMLGAGGVGYLWWRLGR